jgi:starch phosphorylase
MEGNMYNFGKVTVMSKLPESISRLEELANNLWWSWNVESLKLFKSIDPELWGQVGNNPVRFLHEVSQKKLEEASKNSGYMGNYEQILNKFDNYINSSDTWYSKNYPNHKDNIVAYFSAEYGLDEILAIYSGGLGVLSGDHCKTASDLGIPFVAIGLLYREGYFNQYINAEGWQETSFTEQNMYSLPVKPTIGEDGEEVIVSIDLPGRVVHAKVWTIKVGRVCLYMLDTKLDVNSITDRELTARLYGGDQEMRISQEILLGIGGARVLEALNISPTVYHMNEGHSSFLGLELMRKLIQEKGFSFKIAKEIVSACTVFTTHTPVPAGNDAFPISLIDKYFGNYWNLLGISRSEFLDLGRKGNADGHEMFNMTILALKVAGKKNGVSELHGAVSRSIFSDLWPNVPEDEIPIGHVTNGIHTLTWMDSGIKMLLARHIGEDWIERIHEQDMWNKVYDIPDEELWTIHMNQKRKLTEIVQNRLTNQKDRHGESPSSLKEIGSFFNPEALTIGFARRFATYKRANLIFRDIDRLINIINDPKKPLQIVYSGKAHPADRPAHELIKQIYDYTNRPELRGKVVFIENYNMNIARYLTHGVDVWLNNPRRPLEASGTSGQKSTVNGVPNFSVLDGWWIEGYNRKNGWAIGENKYYQSYEQQDNADSESLYFTLENEIIPLYFNRDEKGIPRGWVATMKEAIVSCGFKFSTYRMLQDYIEYAYMPQIERTLKIRESNYQVAAQLNEWKSMIQSNWSTVQISPEKDIGFQAEKQISVGQSIETAASVYLGNISPEDVEVELYYGRAGTNGTLENPSVEKMNVREQTTPGTYIYSTDMKIDDGGNYGYTFRVAPVNPNLINKHDMALIKWVI